VALLMFSGRSRCVIGRVFPDVFEGTMILRNSGKYSHTRMKLHTSEDSDPENTK
jgi:hypothetical protein